MSAFKFWIPIVFGFLNLTAVAYPGELGLAIQARSFANLVAKMAELPLEEEYRTPLVEVLEECITLKAKSSEKAIRAVSHCPQICIERFLFEKGGSVYVGTFGGIFAVAQHIQIPYLYNLIFFDQNGNRISSGYVREMGPLSLIPDTPLLEILLRTLKMSLKTELLESRLFHPSIIFFASRPKTAIACSKAGLMGCPQLSRMQF